MFNMCVCVNDLHIHKNYQQTGDMNQTLVHYLILCTKTEGLVKYSDINHFPVITTSIFGIWGLSPSQTLNSLLQNIYF